MSIDLEELKRLLARAWRGVNSTAEDRELCASLHHAIPALIAELEALREFHAGVMECEGDTWECERCGNSEPWWKDTNADYATRETCKKLVNARKESA